MELSSKQRAYLRSLSNDLDVIVHIGKDGIGDNLVKQANDALEARELIKCRVLENSMLTAREACDELSALTRSEQVQVIGTKFVLYRPSHKKEKKDKIVLATVKGDIHDIGKNIVKVLLENYSYDVLDLGKDVPPETIVETAVEKHIELVGLSALMTTTMVRMRDTVDLVKQRGLGVDVMVGGAVVTPAFAESIGANYSSDAVDAVRLAKSLIAARKNQ